MPIDPQQAKEKSRQIWDSFAPLYDKYITSTTSQAAKRVVDLAALQKGQRVLDVATGTGVAAFAAAEKVGPTGYVIGIDLSEGILGIAQERASAQKLQHVELRPMDAEKLQFSDKTFDAVTCCLGLMLFPEPPTALAEMKRVLKPGGRVAFAVWGTPDRMIMGSVFELLRKYLPEDIPPLPPQFAFGAPGAIESALQNAGFVEPRTERHFYQMNWATLETGWEIIRLGGPVGALVQKLSIQQQEVLRKEIFELLRRYQTSAGVEVPFEMVFATAKCP